MKKNLTLVLIDLFMLTLFLSRSGIALAASTPGDPQWAETTVTAPAGSDFFATAVDSRNNIYAAGHINGNGEFDFGNGVTVTGNNATDNGVIVKYNSSGVTQWAETASTAPGSSFFSALAIGPDNSICVGGYINGNVEFNFGNGATVTGGDAGNDNAVIIKYSSAGVAQWAKTAATAPSDSGFNGISVGPDNNIYAVGYIDGNTQYDFGNGATVTGNSATDNGVIVKYNSSGTAQWAESAITAPSIAWFDSVSVSADNNIYIGGYISDGGEYDFGNGVTVTGKDNSSDNAVIIKYSSAGVAQWAKAAVTAPADSTFTGIVVGSDNNIYAAGKIGGNSEFDFGNGATVTGGDGSGDNTIIVKYNSSGLAQWAKSTTPAAPSDSYFTSISVDSSDNVYAAGEIGSNTKFNFGSGVTVSGGDADDNNGFVIKYNSSGVAQWARSAVTAPEDCYLYGISVDSNGNAYAVGMIDGNGEYNFGNNVTATGAINNDNTVIIKYAGDITSTPATSVVTALPATGMNQTSFFDKILAYISNWLSKL
jgi:hypothetical protein